MLYVINGKYYMLRNREYVKVDLKLDDNELSIKPDRTDVIEKNNDIKVKKVLIDDIVRELKNGKSSLSRDSENRNKYDR